MRTIEIDGDYTSSLFDSDTMLSLITEKVVDITDDCPTGERTILLFTRAKRGPIVQVCHPYEGHKYFGSHIHFFINELDRNLNPRDDSFASTAQRAGLSRWAFQQLVERAKP